MDFRVSRAARDRHAFDEALFATSGDTITASPAAARRFAQRLIETGGARPDRVVQAGEIGAMGLIHELFHLAIGRSRKGTADGGPLNVALRDLGEQLPSGRLDRALAGVEFTFPATDVYQGLRSPADRLASQAHGVTGREEALEELLLLWIENQNPAFLVYDDLVGDDPLEADGDYPAVVDALRRTLAAREDKGPGEDADLVERLLAPGRAAPHSLAGQLRYIREHWAGWLDPALLDRLTLELGILAEEEAALGRIGMGAPDFSRGAGPAGAPTAGFGGLGEEVEAFSPDKDWMPHLVLMAKSTYVWLDQLSRAYERPIRTLDAIPDEELDRLRDRGFTGLWLIGLWERSHASQRIKQLRGNPDAVASAYSLYDYRIADDLGGEAAWENLRDRAWQRGVRLASDMVPNHMGLDSRWVLEHPDWFLGRDDLPYPAYSFNGPNLSNDERVGIWLEDHYYDSSDAAVVFKREDRWSGQVRYLYHGNDGTSFPWNDTAQLDYLNAEAREAVIQTILAVARRFPVIRFDAAMVLAKRHVQRLWYPLPGSGGAIPSRAEAALTQEAFDAAMPAEFWREVVDRVAAEVPDTLLLAEAFWMLEGYFVRTLGMHRVYNSAFMHMLRDEHNAEYRGVIRETLNFDARILGRYVNFMNNPDEKTAVDQFGDGDKYFGIATLMATMPGLPMVGHGQVEGFSEKYGMEFRRARLDERPNEGLIARHEHDLFPLFRQRWRFAGADHFRLLDAQRGDGSIDDDVFAYTNRAWESRSLVVYRNKWAEGRVTIPGVADGLGVPDDANAWLILRDHRTGLEFLRNAHDLATKGLELDLHAYGCHVFLDPELVWDGPTRDWARLAWRIGLAGVPSVRGALDDQLLEPLRQAAGRLFTADLLRMVAGSALARTDDSATTLLAVAVEGARSALEDTAAVLAGSTGGDAGAMADRSAAVVEAGVRALVSSVRGARAGGGDPDHAALAKHLGVERRTWSPVIGAIAAEALGSLGAIGESGTDAPATDPLGAFDGWHAGAALAEAVRATGLDEAVAWRIVAVVRAMLATPVGALADAADAIGPDGLQASFVAHPAVRAAVGFNSWDGRDYVDRDGFGELARALAARDLLAGRRGTFGAAERVAAGIAAVGFRVAPPPPRRAPDPSPRPAAEPEAPTAVPPDPEPEPAVAEGAAPDPAE